MARRELSPYIDITVVCRLADVSPSTVRRCTQLGLIRGVFDAEELAELRRIRRLTSLGVNLAGVEVILHMRRQIEQLREEINQLEALLSPEFERDVR